MADILIQGKHFSEVEIPDGILFYRREKGLHF